MRNEDDWISSYVRLTTNIESSILYRTWAGVFAVSAALRRKCYLQWSIAGDIYPNFYIVLVGTTGIGKSVAIKPAVGLLSEIPNIIMAPQSATNAGLIELFSTDAICDIQGPTGSHGQHSSISVAASELAVFLGFGDSEKLSFLTDIWDCQSQPWQRRTRGHGAESIPGVWLNLIGGTTPKLLKTVLPQDTGIEGGLSSRMIFVYADDIDKEVPIPLLSMEDSKLRARILVDLEHISMLTGPFKVTTEWVEEWIPWYYKCSKDRKSVTDGIRAGFLSRRPVNVLKLCMILSASESDNMEIDVEHLNKAIEMLREVESTMDSCFSGMGRVDYSDLIPRITALIALYKTVKFNHLFAKVVNDVRVSELQEIIEALRRSGACTVEWTNGEQIITYKKKEREQ